LEKKRVKGFEEKSSEKRKAKVAKSLIESRDVGENPKAFLKKGVARAGKKKNQNKGRGKNKIHEPLFFQGKEVVGG